jgi:hypothetical protein
LLLLLSAACLEERATNTNFRKFGLTQRFDTGQILVDFGKCAPVIVLSLSIDYCLYYVGGISALFIMSCGKKQVVFYVDGCGILHI